MNYQNDQNYRYDSNKTLKKNSRRILYVTVIVAALFVAVISGTFAYFQLSITLNENQSNINGGIYDVTAALNSVTVNKISGTGANGDKLIPLDTNNAYDTATSETLNGSTTGAAMVNIALQNNCIDANGYTACHVYKIDIKESANAPRVLIDGSVTLTGTKGLNLRLTSIKARSTTNATSASSLTTTDTYYNGAVTLTTLKSSNPNVYEDTLTFTSIDAANNNYLPANTVDNYYYLIVWLEDDGTNQTSVNGGGNYVGTVTITAVNGGNQRITATFSSGA